MNSSFNAAIFHRGKKLAIDEVEVVSERCPICLTVNPKSRILSLQTDPDIFLNACEVCGGVSASRMPTAEALNSYYGSYYSDNDTKVTFHNIERFADHVNRLLTGEIRQSKLIRLIDYGGGDGSLGLALAKKLKSSYNKIEVVLVDYNIEKSFSDSGIFFQSFKDLSDVPGQFHIVLASAVFEHVPNLNRVLVKLYSMLTSEGYLYARTPYIVPFKKIFNGLDFTYPGHVHDLGPSFWNNFSKPLQFEWDPVVSRASIVETQFRHAFLRTLISYLCKFPSRVEEKLFGRILKKPLWKFVGGWEVLFKKK